MKLIRCIVRPSKAEAVCTAMEHAGVSGCTVTDVRRHSLVPSMLVEVVAADENVDDILATVMKTVGDGQIFVEPGEPGDRVGTGDLELQ